MNYIKKDVKEKRKGRTFNFVNSIKGGCGKTTFSIFLARYLCTTKQTEKEDAEASDKCLILDMDFQGTSMESLFLGALESKGENVQFKKTFNRKYLNAAIRDNGEIADYIVHNKLTDEVVIDAIFADTDVHEKEKLRILPKMGYSPVVQYNIFRGGFLRFIKKFDSGMYKHFIFDMPPNSDGFSGAAMECVMHSKTRETGNFFDTYQVRKKKDVVNLFYVTGIDPGQIKETIKEIREQLVNRDSLYFDNLFIVMNDNIPINGTKEEIIDRNVDAINQYFGSMISMAGVTEKDYKSIYLVYMDQKPEFSTYCIRGNGLNNIKMFQNLDNEVEGQASDTGSIDDYIPISPVAQGADFDKTFKLKMKDPKWLKEKMQRKRS